ncbi:hypothetical protein SUGI_1035500 [Cryptomeria japonica]|nr:hypothetical protein SUGI_1035500 [Cryptomeria japonica]
MNALISHLPQGYRFRPTEEELIEYYLKKRIASERIDMDLIRDINLYKIEPWDLQEIYGEESREWYVFNKNNKKGGRINRCTAGGRWRDTGHEKEIHSNSDHDLIGRRKTLVFRHKGRSHNAQISEWVMHEYRLETPQEVAWVLCHVFRREITVQRKRKYRDNEEAAALEEGSSESRDVAKDQVEELEEEEEEEEEEELEEEEEEEEEEENDRKHVSPSPKYTILEGCHIILSFYK